MQAKIDEVGDEDQDKDSAFERFFEAESERLLRFGFFLTSDWDVAADLAQDTLARVYRHWGRIRGTDPGPYARKTLVNLWRNARRRRLREGRRSTSGPEVSAGHAGGVVEALRVAEALQRLSRVQRAAVVLRYYEDRPVAEIARVLGRPEGTVKSDLHRALARLRPLLEEETT